MMKRILPFFLMVALLTVCLSGCGKSAQISDLSRASYVEVRAFSMSEQGYTDYVISDYQTVNEICTAFSDLTLKKVKDNCKPHQIAYTLQFYNHSHALVDSITVLTDGNTLDYDGDLYNVDFNVQAYMDGVVAKLTPARPDGAQ